MRTLRKNKQGMYYSLYEGEQPVYVLDEDGNKIVSYVDDEGNVYYQETGEYVTAYADPVFFMGNISMSGGEARAEEYGVDVSQYDAVLVLDKNQIPVTETSLIWHTSKPEYEYVSGNKVVDRHSADYRVEAIKPSLNQLKILLGKIVK